MHDSLEQLRAASESITAPTESSNLVEDIVKLKSAARGYEANMAVIKASDDLARVTIDLLI